MLEDARLDRVEAPEPPRAGDHAIDEERLQVAHGRQLGQEVLAEGDQARPVLVGEEDLAREEAVGAGVLAGDGLPLGRARAR